MKKFNPVLKRTPKYFVVGIALCLSILTFASMTQAATFTTIADGDWSSASTWQGGNIPDTSSDIPSGDTINIRHTVNYNTGNPIKNQGTILIQPIVGTTAILNIPTNINVENFSGANFSVINGMFMQCRFVGCGNSGTAQSGTWKNIGGTVVLRNANVEVAQDWVNESGGHRTMEDSCVTTGQNFSISSSTEIIRRSTISLGWHGSGNWQYSGNSLTLEAVQIEVRHDGNVQLSSGSANGDFDKIWQEGNGTISSSSGTSGSVAIDSFCSANAITDDGSIFGGAQTSDCTPVTANCQPSAKLIVVKNASPPTNLQTFNFTISNFPNFNLVDNDPNNDPMMMFEVTNFASATRITELDPTPYQLTNIGCVVDVGTNGTPTPVWAGAGTNFIDVSIQPGDQVTCTFTNDLITAAQVTLAGRVRTRKGNGIRGAFVTITDSEGNIRYARTNNFGHYQFENIDAGESYTVNIKHKRFRFLPQIINVSENITNLDFRPTK